VAEQRQQAQQRRTQAAARAESRFVISLPAAALAQHRAAAPGALIHEALSRAAFTAPGRHLDGRRRGLRKPSQLLPADRQVSSFAQIHAIHDFAEGKCNQMCRRLLGIYTVCDSFCGGCWCYL